MVDRKYTPKNVEVGGPLFEGLAFAYLEKKYGISQKELLDIVAEKHGKDNTFPLVILKAPKLSSLESIVKFLRENRKLSYNKIGELLDRNSKTLAVTYNVARKKMPEVFAKDTDLDKRRIPFNIFQADLSILECICVYLKSQNHSYAEIARMIDKDQRTIWTVCKRAEKKSGKNPVKKNIRIDDGRISG